MKKIIILTTLTILFPLAALALESCPYGLTNDPYPGNCGRYVDENSNDICDLSETEETTTSATQTVAEDLISGQDLKTKNVKEVAEIYQIDPDKYAQALSDYYKITIKTGNSFQTLHDNYGLEPSQAKEIAQNLKDQIPTAARTSTSAEKNYHLGSIALATIVFYLFTLWLSKIKKISLVNHRRIWNLALLTSFLVSAILGILLVIRINFQIVFPLPFNMLFWHVEAGIAMTIISIFHILWHWQYFKCYIKIKRNVSCE